MRIMREVRDKGHKKSAKICIDIFMEILWRKLRIRFNQLAKLVICYENLNSTI